MDKCRQLGTVLKLDISKAYDSVDWEFMFKVLRKLGIGDKVLNLIKECIIIVKYSALVNGVPRESFEASRGIRQGDPFSPYLFIILAEVIARNFNFLVYNGTLKGIKPTSFVPPTILQ